MITFGGCRRVNGVLEYSIFKAETWMAPSSEWVELEGVELEWYNLSHNSQHNPWSASVSTSRDRQGIQLKHWGYLDS